MDQSTHILTNTNFTKNYIKADDLIFKVLEKGFLPKLEDWCSYDIDVKSTAVDNFVCEVECVFTEVIIEAGEVIPGLNRY